MNKINFFRSVLAISFISLFISCSSDDDNNNDNTPAAEDCYTCTVANTKYCYTTGNTFYTVTVGSMAPIQQPLTGGLTWIQIKTSLQASCQ
jgi:hypothetical protein